MFTTSANRFIVKSLSSNSTKKLFLNNIKINNTGLKFNANYKSFNPSMVGVMGTRFASTQAELEPIIKPIERITETLAPASTQAPAGFVEPTTLPEIPADALSTYTDFASMGLCNYTPVGALEKVLEVIQVTSGLPWYGTIAVVTVLIRVIMLPLMISLNKSATRIANVKPEMEAITTRINRAKADNDHYELALQSQKLRELFKKHDLKPFRMMLMPLAQMPVMISFFFALQAMSAVPVPSLLDGGMLWFQNLAIADPYYVLPVISSLGFLAVFEMGSELGAAAAAQPPMMKVFMRIVPFIMIPVTANLPSALFMYWIPSSLFSMFQIYALNNQRIRALLKMPKLVVHQPKRLSPKELKAKKNKKGLKALLP